MSDINNNENSSSKALTSLNINATANKEFDYEKIKEIANWIAEKVSTKPEIAIVCGSGLGGLGERLIDPLIMPYKTIPNFPSSTVAGHKGNLIFGKLKNVDVVCMQGRFHSYEGYANSLCTLPIRVFKLLGIKKVILTCAAGGINQSYNVGDIMMIKDHISFPLLSLQHPLVGPNDEKFGPRFPPANRIYNKHLRDLFRQTADELKIKLHEGVYVASGGPSYETVSEMRAYHILGGDVAGMSTAQEAIVANHCGIEVMALALVTNKGVFDYDSEVTPNHEEVMEIANKRAKDIEELVITFVQKIV